MQALHNFFYGWFTSKTAQASDHGPAVIETTPGASGSTNSVAGSRFDVLKKLDRRSGLTAGLSHLFDVIRLDGSQSQLPTPTAGYTSVRVEEGPVRPEAMVTPAIGQGIPPDTLSGSRVVVPQAAMTSQTIAAGNVAIPQIAKDVQARMESIVRNTGLTTAELSAMREHLEKETEKWGKKTDPFVIRREDSKLTRSLLIIPQEDGTVKVYALLKEKGGQKMLGLGFAKKATWAVEIQTGEKKVFLSERRERIGDALRAINDRERDALIRYAGVPGFCTGRVVTYQHKRKWGPGGILPGSGKEKRGVLVEPALGGDLSDYIFIQRPLGAPHTRKRGQGLSEQQLLSIVHGVASSLAVMHQPDLQGRKYMHLDIKPANILVDEQDGQLVVKLADFGFTYQVGTLDIHCGTGGYNAPELGMGKPLRSITEKADVWSFGMMLFDLKLGKEFSSAEGLGYTNGKLYPDNEQVLNVWKEKNLPNRRVVGSIDWAIDQSLQWDPQKRLSMAAIRDAMSARIKSP